jgi:hypothetical protein
VATRPTRPRAAVRMASLPRRRRRCIGRSLSSGMRCPLCGASAAVAPTPTRGPLGRVRLVRWRVVRDCSATRVAASCGAPSCSFASLTDLRGQYTTAPSKQRQSNAKGRGRRASPLCALPSSVRAMRRRPPRAILLVRDPRPWLRSWARGSGVTLAPGMGTRFQPAGYLSSVADGAAIPWRMAYLDNERSSTNPPRRRRAGRPRARGQAGPARSIQPPR